MGFICENMKTLFMIYANWLQRDFHIDLICVKSNIVPMQPNVDVNR